MQLHFTSSYIDQQPHKKQKTKPPHYTTKYQIRPPKVIKLSYPSLPLFQYSKKGLILSYSKSDGMWKDYNVLFQPSILIQLNRQVQGGDMKSEEHEHTREQSSRATNIGYLTQQHDELQEKIEELIVHHDFKMDKLMDLCSRHPRIKEEYSLIHEYVDNLSRIFKRKDLVEDMIRFVFMPRKMMVKYELEEGEGLRYVEIIKSFLLENNELYEHFFLGSHHHAFHYNIWFQFLDHQSDDTFPSALANLNDILIPIIKYQYSSSSRICEFFQSEQQEEQSILILNYFTPGIIDRLIANTRYHAVFQVLFNLIIASLEEQEWRMSLIILERLFISSIQNKTEIPQIYRQTLDSHIQSIYTMITEVSNNISKDKHNTIFAFTNVIYETNLLGCCINRLQAIIRKHLQGEQHQELQEEITESIEYNLKCISEIMKIYYLLRKNGIDDETEQMKKTKKSIVHLFHEFPSLLPLLKYEHSSLTMSNGQKIKSLSIYKYQLFNLIKNSLQLIKDYGQSSSELSLNIEKVQLLELSIKHLTDFRWNNILHCLLQKIISLTVSREMFKTKSQAIHKILNYLVQAFINKKYIFLNSMRMTNQGNLHFIYNVSCLISLELQKANTFYDISNPYEEWDNFMKTLQKYEEKHKKYKQSQFITDEEIREAERNEKYELKVEIDELVSIKEIIEKREIYTKWRQKDKKEHHHQKDLLNRTSNSAKSPKSNSLVHYNQHIKNNEPRRRSLLYQEYLNSSIKVQKKFSSSDGFANKCNNVLTTEMLKKTISIDEDEYSQFTLNMSELNQSEKDE